MAWEMMADLTDPPINQWIHLTRVGDHVWVDDEKMPLEVFQHLRDVESKCERDKGRALLSDHEERMG